MMKSIIIPKLDLHGKTFDIVVPSSKSLTNRALILAAVSRGECELKGDFGAADIQIMLGALQKMGIRIETIDDNETMGVRIQNDLSWMEDDRELELFLGNSGTSIRFLTSLVLFRNGETILTGKERMKERPIRDLVEALGQIGAEIEYLEQEGYPPLRVKGLKEMTGHVIKIRGDVSSQFLTSLLLVGSAFSRSVEVLIDGPLISRPYVEMTLDLLRKWDVSVQRGAEGFRMFPQQLLGTDMVIEGDASAATYWWALGFLHDCVINVKNVQNDSKQGDVQFKKVLNILANSTNEFEIDMNDMPDAAMTLMAVAPFHTAALTITNVASLRVKETDRIEAMATELGKCGVEVETGKDWVKIYSLLNTDFSTSSRPFANPPSVEMTKAVETYDDHRIAMSMAVFGTMVGNVEILDPDCVSKTYPNFWNDLRRIETESRH